jgi:predicted O-linked N-acetylglucosamine transferase (SPINDLY family)
MAILRATSQTVLWLQAPHNEKGGGRGDHNNDNDEKDDGDGNSDGGGGHDVGVVGRLRAEAAARGVHPSRLFFAERADRTE